MNLIDLMEIWALKNNTTEPMNMLKQGQFDSRIDKDLLAGKIVEVCGAMYPVYNTTDSYSYFHTMFFKMWMPQITRLLDTMDYEYEPLENFKRHENLVHGATETVDTTDTNNGTTQDNTTNSSTSEDKTSAFNESVYQPSQKNESSGTLNNSGEHHNTRVQDKDRNFNSTDNNNIHGLNGMYTSQQLLEQQRKVAEYNVYQWIVQKYMEELFICVF